RKSKAQDEPILETLDVDYEKDMAKLKDQLVDKLLQILGETKSAGVFNNFKEEIVKKGTKFIQKNLSAIDYSIVNPTNWTADAQLNTLVGRVIHNFNIKANDLLGIYKRKKFHISVGDDLPAGIVKMAKVYIAKKRKLKVG